MEVYESKFSTAGRHIDSCVRVRNDVSSCTSPTEQHSTSQPIMYTFLKALAAAAAFLSPVAHAHAIDPAPWGIRLDGTFDLEFQRYDTLDCSQETIGEKVHIKQGHCHSWDDDRTFNGFKYYASPTSHGATLISHLRYQISGTSTLQADGSRTGMGIALSGSTMQPIAWEQ